MSFSPKLSRAGSWNVTGQIDGTRKRDRLVETVVSGSIPASVSRLASTVAPLAKIIQLGFLWQGAMMGIHLKATQPKITPTHSVLLALSRTLSIITDGP